MRKTSFKHPANTDALKRNTHQLWFIFLSRMWLLFYITCLLHSVSYLLRISSSILHYLSYWMHIPNHMYSVFCPGVGGTPRPIELHSHDPLRYVGDMLAWLHQAAATEKEHLLTVLKRCESMKYSFYLCRTLQNKNIFFDLPFNYRHFTCLPFHLMF